MLVEELDLWNHLWKQLRTQKMKAERENDFYGEVITEIC